MKKIGSKQILPLAAAIVGLVFAYISFFQLDFWNNEPKGGFFPGIISIVLVAASIALFIQSLKECEQPAYNKEEFMVIFGGLFLIAGAFLIGMIPMIFVYIVFWLKKIEKTPWKETLIIVAVVAAIVLGIFCGWLQVRFSWGIFEYFM